MLQHSAPKHAPVLHHINILQRTWSEFHLIHITNQQITDWQSANFLTHTGLLWIMVKVQFRGPELYKEKHGIKQEESNLISIFRPTSSDWHTFHHVYTAFWSLIFFRKHRKSLLKIGNIAMFWWLTSRSRRHNCRCTRALLPMRSLDREWVHVWANDTLRCNNNNATDWVTAVWCAGWERTLMAIIYRQKLKNTHKSDHPLKIVSPLW